MAPRCAAQTKEATPDKNNPQNHTLRITRSPEARTKLPKTIDASQTAGVSRERLWWPIVHQRVAEGKLFFAGVYQYFQLMSAPGGAVAVMWRAICGRMRW